MKKLVCMLLAIIMVISLVACGAKTDTGTAAPPAGDTAKTEASDTIRLAVVGPMTGQDAMYGT